MTRSRPPLLDLRLTLADSPGVWRRVRMSSAATLARAQRVFCVAFGWPGGRPHAFTAADLRYESGGAGQPLIAVRLRHLLPDGGASLEFEYGDPPWHVMVRAERLLPPSPAHTSPVCLEGEGEAPHVDGAGAWGWEEQHDHHEEPTSRPVIRVNVEAINAELARLP